MKIIHVENELNYHFILVTYYLMSIHENISCDLCRKKNFSGGRYKCLICHDFDLCSVCYEKQSNLSFQKHSNQHSMQLIITSNDYETIYYGCIRTKYSPISLICSICNQNGFSLDILIKHVNEKHFLFKSFILCPICFIRINNLSEHLHQHMNENFNLKIKSSNNQQSLLEKFTKTDQHNNNNTQKRNLFIHNLLTNLLSKNFFDNQITVHI